MIPRDHELADHILDLVPINGLDPRLQAQALDQGELLEYRRRRTVFEAGTRDPYTFYLLDGELELRAEGASPVRMRPGDENARRALAQLQPRRYTAVAITPVILFRIERAVLDHILSDEQMLEEAGGTMDVRELEDDEEDGGDWMTRLLSSALFTRLPHDNIQRFFAELEPVAVEEGEVIVEQGWPGDYLYIVAEGRCQVVRRAPGSTQELQLAVLKEGDSFGEEALISNSPRNATVRMLCDGMLMRLSKSAFEELVTSITLKAVPWSEACKLAANGARWLDVRFPDEHQGTAVEGSINAPLNVLRIQATKLDPDTPYIVYCDSGARSSAGAFLLARMGFDACYLAGGLDRSPLGTGVVHAAAPAAQTTTQEPEAQPAPRHGEDGRALTLDETGQPQPDAGEASAQPEPEAPPAGEDVTHAAPSPGAGEPAPAPAAQGQGQGQGQPAELLRARQILGQLKAERDKAVAFGKQAADAARELKRRNDELSQAVEEERTRREQLQKELGAVRADAQRVESMEQTRLQGELEKTVKRLEALQDEHQQQQASQTGELERLSAELARSEERTRALEQEKDEAKASRAATEVALQESLREARENADRLSESVNAAQAELAATREQLSEAQARSLSAAEERDGQESELARAMREAEETIAAERSRIEEEHRQLTEELEQLRRETGEEESRLRTELEGALAAQQTLRGELQQREEELAQARGAVHTELSEHEQQHASQTRELQRLSAELARSEERTRALEKERDEAGAAHEAAEAALQESLREARENAEKLDESVKAVQAELATTREQLNEAQALSRSAAQERDARESELARAMREAEDSIAAERGRLEEEHRRLTAEIEQLRLENEEEDTRLRAERAELEAALAAQRALTEELEQREQDLEQARGAVDAELSAREEALAQREAKLASEEAALSSDKSAWKDTVEKAIVEERERLEAEYARYREETEATIQERAEALAEERLTDRLTARVDELRGEHEEREFEMRAQVESHVSKLLAEFDERLETVRTGYETRLSEQEAVLEDERRRLEAEIVRLRGALTGTREAPLDALPAQPMTLPGIAAQPPAPAVDADLTLHDEEGTLPEISTAAEPDLQIDESELIEASGETPFTAPQEPDLQIDDSALIEAPGETPAVDRPAPDTGDAVPIIDLPAGDEADEAATAKKPGRSSEKERRVIAPEQLAEIRKRMQEKMRAAKSRSA